MSQASDTDQIERSVLINDAVDPSMDYGKEEPTLVTFTLRDAPGNATMLTVVESGFDKVPPGRRLEAFRMNSRGWSIRMENIVRHVGA